MWQYPIRVFYRVIIGMSRAVHILIGNEGGDREGKYLLEKIRRDIRKNVNGPHQDHEIQFPNLTIKEMLVSLASRP